MLNLREVSRSSNGHFLGLMREKWSVRLQKAVSFWRGSCRVGMVATRAANDSMEQHYFWLV